MSATHMPLSELDGLIAACPLLFAYVCRGPLQLSSDGQGLHRAHAHCGHTPNRQRICQRRGKPRLHSFESYCACM